MELLTKLRYLTIIRKMLYFFSFILFIGMLYFIVMAFVMPFDREIADEFCMVPVSIYMYPSNADVKIGADEYFGEAIDTDGELVIKDGPIFISYLNVLIFIMALSLILFLCWVLIKIIRSIEARNVFTIENARRLRQIAFSFLIFIVLFQLINIISAIFVEVSFDNRYPTQSLVIEGTLINAFEFGDILFAVLLLIVSEIFMIGVKMKEEQDLTI